MNNILIVLLCMFAFISLTMTVVLLVILMGLKRKADESEKRICDLTGSANDRVIMLLNNQSEMLDRRIANWEQSAANFQKDNLTRTELLRETLENRLSNIRQTIDSKMDTMLQNNEKKLEEMRLTVDEKLSENLEKKLNDSFSLVSKQLEAVYKGLGEMQSLAVGVGDLKKVLTNVKTRGIWGEIQLSSLLSQMLTNEQYAENIAIDPNSSERVEFAIILPGKDKGERPVYLPIDSKFPQEDYQRLIDAEEAGDLQGIAVAGKNLEAAVKAQAKLIHDKYIKPPYSTDFAIMFLPVEGLYAEVIRRNGLMEILQREYRVVITGPTTLMALLNSLQMGFRTLAIEKRSSEVWALLGNVKSEFSKFSLVLEKTQQKLKQASDTIDQAATRTRVIERKLRRVEELPVEDSESWYEELVIKDRDVEDD